MVLFSATRQVGGDLAALAEALGDDRVVVVARELTKVHEERWRGTLGEAIAHWSVVEPRGEFTLVVAPLVRARRADLTGALDQVRALRAGGLSLPEAVKRAAVDHEVDRRLLYQETVAERAPSTGPAEGG